MDNTIQLPTLEEAKALLRQVLDQMNTNKAGHKAIDAAWFVVEAALQNVRKAEGGNTDATLNS